MRNFYRFMAKRIPFIWWKFFWLSLVQAHLNKEKLPRQRELLNKYTPTL